MSIRYVLFDLDGTLLPMDQDEFIKAYFGRLAAKLAPHGYNPQTLVDAIWQSTTAMIQNDGSCSNETAFWNRFAQILGNRVRKDEHLFDEFYRKEFQQVQQVCGFTADATRVIRYLKDRGFPLVLATNPIFPTVATASRIRWAGLRQTDFVLFTTYENSCHAKPNPEYYRDILKQLDVAPEECLMIGNDVEEDMVAATLGMNVFLLTDCLINKYGKDISQYPHGNFAALQEYIQTI